MITALKFAPTKNYSLSDSNINKEYNSLIALGNQQGLVEVWDYEMKKAIR